MNYLYSSRVIAVTSPAGKLRPSTVGIERVRRVVDMGQSNDSHPWDADHRKVRPGVTVPRRYGSVESRGRPMSPGPTDLMPQ